MSRLHRVEWKRVIFGAAVIGAAVFIGYFWKQPRYGEDEQFVQSNFQRDSGKWTTTRVTGSDLNELRDEAEPLNRVVSAVLIVGGVAFVAYELRHLRG